MTTALALVVGMVSVQSARARQGAVQAVLWGEASRRNKLWRRKTVMQRGMQEVADRDLRTLRFVPR
jgi:hypothetical protein